MVVEDEKAAARLLRLHLESAGFLVQTESTGATALCAAAERRPDLVILDLKLPDISGYEVCRQLRKRFPHGEVPILMLTALREPIDELRGFAFGAEAYLPKPFDMQELLQTIAILLEERHQPENRRALA